MENYKIKFTDARIQKSKLKNILLTSQIKSPDY